MYGRLSLITLLCMMGGVRGLELPTSCTTEQYYDPGWLACMNCSANNFTVKTSDGFSCECDGHSIPSSHGSCRPCNATEVVSADGRSCVPRKCQHTSGRFVCRKCPSDYVSVTQNLDGSPTKEVVCVKCALGYKAQDNKCLRCESCTCSKSQVLVRGICVPKAYVDSRPKYEEKLLHPLELLDIVKYEYLCTQNDFRACRTLANECVKRFYSIDLGGACRLWLQPKITMPKGLPSLIITPSSNDKNPGEIIIPRHGKDSIFLALAVYTFNGGMKFLENEELRKNSCQLPINIRIGQSLSFDCLQNLTNILSSDYNETFAPFLYADGQYRQLPVDITKPSGFNVQRGIWSTNMFRRYFMVRRSLSTTTNMTNTIYLRTVLIKLRLERVKHVNGSLRITTTIEAQYADKPTHEDTVITTLKVHHEMPNAGVIRVLEILGGVFAAFLTLYALVVYRGLLRRGGPNYAIVPLLAGSTADTMYAAILLSTLHALAAEAGTIGMTLPLSHSEEMLIKAFVYSNVSLKAIKVIWINWKQCTCDIFFLDWSEYNPTVKESGTNEIDRWKAIILAKEWSMMQAARRAPPSYTAVLTLLVLQLMPSWKFLLPESDGYKWAVLSAAWWSSYSIVLLAGWLKERFVRSPVSTLPSICTGVGLSLLVFQEEYYAHYVHGRNDDTKEVRSMAGPLAACRVACVPQVRAVYNQLSTGAGNTGNPESSQALLSRFLAAFFERALDGLNWVASERTICEKLLDVEVTTREAGSTSALLYDDGTTPSCFSMTWWGEEWTLSTFDAALFGCVSIATDNILLAALATIVVWQTMKQIRTYFGNRNQIVKTGVPIYFV